MYRLLVFLFAFVAILHFNTTVTTEIWRLRDGITERLDSLDIHGGFHFYAVISQIRDVVFGYFGALTSAMGELRVSFADFCSITYNSTTLHTSTNNSRVIQSLFEISRRGQDAYDAASVKLRANPGSVCMVLFVFLVIHNLPIQRIATIARRLKEGVAANINNIYAVWEIVRFILEIVIIIMASALWSLAKLTYNLTIHAKSEMGNRSLPETSTRILKCVPEPKTKYQRVSFSDPAIVDRNMKINKLELELQELKKFIDQKNRAHATEEKNLYEQNEALERTNRVQAADLMFIRRFHHSVGLDQGTEAVIRKLRKQVEEVSKQRNEELLGEVHRLQEEIRSKNEYEKEWRDKNRLYNAYNNEVTKWKNIARESIAQRDAALMKAEALQSPSIIEYSEDYDAHQNVDDDKVIRGLKDHLAWLDRFYSPYNEELRKWKSIILESIAQMLAALEEVEDLQKSLGISNGEDDGARQGQDDDVDEVAPDQTDWSNEEIKELKKWKTIAHQCLDEKYAVLDKVEELRKSLAVSNTEDSGARQGYRQDHGGDEVAQDLACAGNTPVGIPGTRSEHDWVNVSGNRNSSDDDDDAKDTGNAETAPSVLASAPLASQGPELSNSFQNPFLKLVEPPISDSSSSSSDDDADKGESAKKGTSMAKSKGTAKDKSATKGAGNVTTATDLSTSRGPSPGPGSSKSFHNPFLKFLAPPTSYSSSSSSSSDDDTDEDESAMRYGATDGTTPTPEPSSTRGPGASPDVMSSLNNPFLHLREYEAAMREGHGRSGRGELAKERRARRSAGTGGLPSRR